MKVAPFSFFKSLMVESRITIVDIGAMYADTVMPSYQSLMDRGLGRLIGFEPNATECQKLTQQYKRNPQYRFFPYAIGDGDLHPFHRCQTSSCSSILKPNFNVCDRFQNFSDYMHVLDTHDLQTHRLDEVVHEDVDYLKIDVQGFELTILQHAHKIVSNVSVAEIEVEFIQQYENQPLFADIAQFMEREGFLFHTFLGYGTRHFKPMVPKPGLKQGMRQWIWSDAVFIKDFWTQNLSPTQLLKMACILHESYQSYDLVCAILDRYDGMMSSHYATEYSRLCAQFIN